MTFSALLDTCVLFPMYLRDSLLRLAVADMYRPMWSTHILDELRQALIRDVMPSERADRVVALMRAHFPESEAVGYEPLMPTLTCHEKDRHVLAAAITARATLLVTEKYREYYSWMIGDEVDQLERTHLGSTVSRERPQRRSAMEEIDPNALISANECESC